MSKQRLIFLIGFWVAILPFLGFPESWKRFLFILTGFLLMWFGFSLSRLQSKIKKIYKEHQTKN